MRIDVFFGYHQLTPADVNGMVVAVVDVLRASTTIAAMPRAAVRGETEVVILCSGHERRFTLEDAGCAGRYVRAIQKGLNEVATNDGATACALIDRKYGENIAKLLQDSQHGQALISAGFGDDVAFCAAVDSFAVVPVYHDRQIVPLGTGRP